MQVSVQLLKTLKPVLVLLYPFKTTNSTDPNAAKFITGPQQEQDLTVSVTSILTLHLCHHTWLAKAQLVQVQLKYSKMYLPL
jgi:hypothetical protein